MKYFLITYDRSAGKILSLEEFDEVDRSKALSKRFSLERGVRDGANVEVVVLGAASLEHLRRTHSRYFMTPSAPAERAG